MRVWRLKNAKRLHDYNVVNLTKWHKKNPNYSKNRDYKFQKKWLLKNKSKPSIHQIGRRKNIRIKPCVVCGSKKNIHRHHFDYRLPDKIIFLCAFHHRNLHLKITSNMLYLFNSKYKLKKLFS